MFHSRNGFLTKFGLEQAAQQTSLEGLTPLSDSVRVDMVGSVSGLVEVEDDFVWCDRLLDQQYRRFHNGS